MTKTQRATGSIKQVKKIQVRATIPVQVAFDPEFHAEMVDFQHENRIPNMASLVRLALTAYMEFPKVDVKKKVKK